jgi:RNase adaptor protein for sRNA GlmZ degradation
VTIFIESFGYLHPAGPPKALLTLDLRDALRDPHFNPDPAFRELTGVDQRVINVVMETPGAIDLVVKTAKLLAGLHKFEDIYLAVGCQGGRHRSVVVADFIAHELRLYWNRTDVVVRHRDIELPVVRR